MAKYNRLLTGFSEACYDTNTIEDLIEALEDRSADKIDCQAWQLTPTQWREAIAEALRAKIFELTESIDNIAEALGIPISVADRAKQTDLILDVIAALVRGE
jgi:hypothetical protein